MCVCVYVCVCMYEWMYECMNVWMYECMNVWMYECMNVWMYECMNVSMNVCMYVCMIVFQTSVCRSVTRARTQPCCIHVYRPSFVHARTHSINEAIYNHLAPPPGWVARGLRWPSLCVGRRRALKEAWPWTAGGCKRFAPSQGPWPCHPTAPKPRCQCWHGSSPHGVDLKMNNKFPRWSNFYFGNMTFLTTGFWSNYIIFR